MSFPGDLLECFSGAEKSIRRAPWFDDDWSACSGLWKTERYPATVVLRLTRRNWSSAFPATLTSGAEIQSAAWADEKLHMRSKVRFEFHIFAFPGRRKIKKRDFTDSFRKTNSAAIATFGFHHTDRGPAVPYAGEYQYKDPRDLHDFLVRDFSNFASLAGSIDELLGSLGAASGSGELAGEDESEYLAGMETLPDSSSAESDRERADWAVLSIQCLSRAYGDNEPDYSIADLRHP